MTAPVLFQFMPPLLPSEYLALTESIKTHGVQVPVIVDENGAIIDGHHRDQIAAELGIDCPREVRAGLDDSTKRTLAISLNKDRRHLTRSQVQALIEESLKADPHLSDRAHAKRVGVSHVTVGAARRSLAGGQVDHLDPGPTVYDLYDPEFERDTPATGSTVTIGGTIVAETEHIDLTTGEVLDPIPETSATTGGGEAPVVAEPRKVTGLDGKQYSRPEPATPRRKALPEQFMTATLALTDRVAAIVRLAEDDRFTANTEKVATANRSDLIRAIDALSGVVAKLPERNPS